MSIDTTVIFADLLQHLIQEIIKADAEMQLLQRSAWSDLVKQYAREADDPERPPSYSIAEGVDRLENLGLTQLQLEFRLAPVKRRWWKRLWCWLRTLFGKLSEKEKAQYRLVPQANRSSTQSILVRLTIERGQDGKWKAHSQPDTAAMENLYVPKVFA